MSEVERVPVQPSPFQALALSYAPHVCGFLGGGKGGSKTYCLALKAAYWVSDYRANARVLFLRQTFPAMKDLELLLIDLFGRIFGGAFRYNASDHLFIFANGATVELGYLSDYGDARRYAGRSKTLLLVDEAGEYPDPALIDYVATNLRGPEGQPTAVWLAGNPGGPGQGWLSQRYVYPAEAWTEFKVGEKGLERTWVYMPSTFRDNPHLDQKQYEATLSSLRRVDPELAKALIEGDWGAKRGAFFGGVLQEDRCSLDPALWTPEWIRRLEQYANQNNRNWFTNRSPLRDPFIAHDWGMAAPSVTLLCYRVRETFVGPDQRAYIRGSLLVVDEYATADPESPNRGLGLTVPEVAQGIIRMALRWGHRLEYNQYDGSPHTTYEYISGGVRHSSHAPPGTRPVEGCADDAIFAQGGHSVGSIANEFRRCGVRFRAANKGGRAGRFETMRRLFADAGSSDQPGLYVSRRCTYFWSTVPLIARDPKDPEVPDSRGADHALDAISYSLNYDHVEGPNTGLYREATT